MPPESGRYAISQGNGPTCYCGTASQVWAVRASTGACDLTSLRKPSKNRGQAFLATDNSPRRRRRPAMNILERSGVPTIFGCCISISMAVCRTASHGKPGHGAVGVRDAGVPRCQWDCVDIGMRTALRDAPASHDVVLVDHRADTCSQNGMPSETTSAAFRRRARWNLWNGIVQMD